ncbi:carotenoid ester lipase [Trametes sanguinea]|nr:carotenoid ester lipase [Trametes sanguinea]
MNNVSAASGPTVKLDHATVLGITDSTTGTDQYLGIPFAQPPVGKLRLQLPQPIPPYTIPLNATAIGNQCFQANMTPPTLPTDLDLPPEISEFLSSSLGAPAPPQSEDCLNINVVVPAGTKPGANLPVAAWIYGGAYQVGSDASFTSTGAGIVNRSVELGQPLIFVTMNYRLGVFGFLGGNEVHEAGVGNLGLQDQREALRWIQKYISAFGGDPAKVTIWGESAGSQSVAYHMITNGGSTEGLFRAAWMESGAVEAVGNITKLQSTFDFIASEVGCSSSSDVLACLREVPAADLRTAGDKTPNVYTYQGINTPWFPRADGKFLTEDPYQLVLKGVAADVPFVIGDCEDEGTLFSLASLNVTTDDEFVKFVKDGYFPTASNEAMDLLMHYYPADPAAGSPFQTGDAYAFTPEYKRIAAFQGDFIFESARRFFLNHLSHKQKAWSFMSKRSEVKGLGAAHSTDLQNVFGGGDMADFLIRFVNTLDPNGGPEINWPAYTPETPELLAFIDGEKPLEITPDTFRKEAMEYLMFLGLVHPV